MEDCEGEGDIQDDSTQTGSDSHVEAADTLLSPDLSEAISEAVVLVGIDALHLGLDDVDGVVGHSGAETCEGTGHQVDDDLVGNVVGESFLSVLEYDESHTLVG